MKKKEAKLKISLKSAKQIITIANGSISARSGTQWQPCCCT